MNSDILAIVNPSVRLSVCLSVRHSPVSPYNVKTTPATIMRSSLGDSPMTLVSSWLTLQKRCNRGP